MENCKPEQKLTLMVLLEKLSYRAAELRDLRYGSNELLLKFLNPIPTPCEAIHTCNVLTANKNSEPTLLEMFDGVISQMNADIFEIQSILGRVRNMVD